MFRGLRRTVTDLTNSFSLNKRNKNKKSIPEILQKRIGRRGKNTLWNQNHRNLLGWVVQPKERNIKVNINGVKIRITKIKLWEMLQTKENLFSQTLPNINQKTILHLVLKNQKILLKWWTCWNEEYQLPIYKIKKQPRGANWIICWSIANNRNNRESRRIKW